MGYPESLEQVTLRRYETLEAESERTHTQAHLIRIQAVAVTPGDDVNIFVHQLEPLDHDSQEYHASFTNVCSPADYNELPIGVPSSTDDYTLFRLDEISHYARSRAELDLIWDSVVQEVNELLDAFRRANEQTGTPTEETTLG